jgi:hypothetical protein
MNLLVLLKMKVVGTGSREFSVLADQVTEVLLTVAMALLAKRMANMVTTMRDRRPPETVL